jgi:hypothetical protein
VSIGVSHTHCTDVCERAVKLLSIVEHHEWHRSQLDSFCTQLPWI